MERKQALPKIFIVDDEEINLKFLHRILSTEYDVSSTSESNKAIDLIRNFNPDLILLDVYMPVLNGFDLGRRIIADKKLKKIPIIFISSLRDSEHTKTGLSIGAVDFISKPINKDETIARIKTHLKISRLQKELAESNKQLKNLLDKKNRKLSEEKLEKNKLSVALVESEKRFQSIFEQAPEAIFIISAESGEIIDANNVACTLSEYTYNELVGMNQVSLLQPSEEKIKSNYFKLQNSVNNEDSVRMTLNTLVTKSGNLIPVQNSSRTLLIEGELYLFGVVFDLRSRIETEKQLIKAKEEAEKHNRLKSSLLSNISHELRTPLVGMLGFSNMLEEELEDESLKYMARSITISGKRLLNTLKVLLDFSTLESKNYQPQLQNVSLNSTITNVVKSFKESYEERGLNVEVNLPQNDICIIAAYAFIEEVFSQLINNAITFTHYGSISIKLDVEKTNNGKSFAVVSIKDTGIGMSESKLELIFEEFRQLSEGFSREYDGLGLGLTLVKKIVELHNGEIFVQSKEGEGTLFQIKLEIEKQCTSEE